MAYVYPNYKTKKELKEAVAAGKSMYVQDTHTGQTIENGSATLEGPHYPQPHKWYAQVELKEGKIVKVK